MRNRPKQTKRESGVLLIFALAFMFNSFAGAVNLNAMDQEEGVQAERQVTGDDIKRGERLFNGLLPLGRDAASCSSCHNTAPIDNFNWNPSAREVSVSYRESSVEDLASVLLDPSSLKMMEVHTGYELSEEEIFLIKAFMDDVAVRDIARRPVITKMLIFVIMLLAFLGAIADLVIFRKVPYKLVHLAVILGTGLFMVKTVAHEAVALGRSQYYEPDQPIKFSHMVHAGDNRTDCLYCHSIAEYSHKAGIPSVSQCMNCHIIVREGTHSGRFEINKLVDAWENEMPVRWIKVHKLADHAFFSHAQHVGAAGIDCSECHGEVEKMHRLMQVSDLSMGWCLDCHRTTGVDILNNEFYSVYMQLREDVTTGKLDMATARETGGTNCMKCHY